MPTDSPHPRNHTSRIGRLITAVDAIYQQRMELTAIVAQIVRDTERNPVRRAQQLMAEYELKTGEKPHELLVQAIELLSDRFNGLIDTFDQYSVSVETMAVIVEERTWWNATHKRNSYNAQAQARRRAKLSGQREISRDDMDAMNAERGIPPAEPKPWTDEELASGVWRQKPSQQWLNSRREQDEQAQREAAESGLDGVVSEPHSVNMTPEVNIAIDEKAIVTLGATLSERTEPEIDERTQYERDRAERQRKEAELLANRSGGPIGGVKS